MDTKDPWGLYIMYVRCKEKEIKQNHADTHQTMDEVWAGFSTIRLIGHLYLFFESFIFNFS